MVRNMQSHNALHKMKKALEKDFSSLTTEQLDSIGENLSLYKSDSRRIETLTELGLSEDIIAALLLFGRCTCAHVNIQFVVQNALGDVS